MTEEMRAEVDKWRKKGIVIEGEVVDTIVNLCKKKMEMANMGEDDAYLGLMFKDELKNYLIRKVINMETELRLIERSIKEDVYGVQTKSLPSEMPKRRPSKGGAYLQQVRRGNIPVRRVPGLA